MHGGFRLSSDDGGRPAPHSGWDMDQLSSKFLCDELAPTPFGARRIWAGNPALAMYGSLCWDVTSYQEVLLSCMHAHRALTSLGVGVGLMSLNCVSSSGCSGELGGR